MSARLRANPARRHETGAGSEAPWLVIGLGLVFLLVLVGAVLVAAAAGGADLQQPMGYLLGLLTGRSAWPPGWLATAVLIVEVAVVLSCGAASVWVFTRRDARSSPRVDGRARSMATARDLGMLLPAGSAADARRLRSTGAGMGTPIGQTVLGWEPLRSSYEWVQAWVIGPRGGKTSCVVVRQICETNGPVVATSNKRDVVDLTRLARLELGHCWVYDPQDLIGEPPSWWWNPLSYVTSVDQADELAGLFASSSAEEGARSDAYFEPEATTYLSNLLLAAASSGCPITALWDWMTDPSDRTPVEVLEVAGHPVAARALEGVNRLADGQRDGVIGTARKMVAWLRNPQILRWITPKPDGDDATDPRPQFDPARFITTRQTLYLISREGDGSARAITAALAVATMRAGEHLASRSPGGRLRLPMHVVLDEAANVVRWRALPDMYSHFGSRGIVLSTFFQSWSQGCRAYTKAGMETLWSAANVRVVGSGVAEADFLESMSRLIGDHDVVTRDRSVAPSAQGALGGRVTTSSRLRRERILEPAELAGMPPGRAVMLAAGAPAALIRLTHWSEAPYADQVRTSQEHFAQAAAIAETPQLSGTRQAQ